MNEMVDLRPCRVVGAEFIPKDGQDWLYYRLRDPATPKQVKDRIAMRLLKTEKPDLEAVAIARVEGDLGERLDRLLAQRKAREDARVEARVAELIRGRII